MGKEFLSLENVSVSIGGKALLHGISFVMSRSEQWALIGHSGAGKTILAETIGGRHFHSGKIKAVFGNQEDFQKQILIVDQQPRFKDFSNQSKFYYQQRYNASDAGLAVTVAEDLDSWRHVVSRPAGDFSEKALLDLLQLTAVLQEPLIQLSSGEQKRLQILKALLVENSLMILDQPLTGLDSDGRAVVERLFSALAGKGKNLLVILKYEELPESITHLAMLENGRLVFAGPIREHKKMIDLRVQSQAKFDKPLLHDLRAEIPVVQGTDLVRMVDVNISYGAKKALDHINWNIKAGECWSLSGPNGAGKSTLLSLINGDHPQAYANEIYLFGKRRGSGESIWDIKQKIGFLSAELHLYFESGINCFQVLASGFFDTIGLFRKLSAQQSELVGEWFGLLALRGNEERLFSSLSLGQQRLVLMARALIKHPPLLILDEPCHGLDASQSAAIRSLIDQYARIPGVSMIYVTHYPNEVPEVVSHFLRLESGKIKMDAQLLP